MFDKKIYECDLISISSDIEVNKDWSKKKNIIKAINENKYKVVKKIYVQKTLKNDYFKEIVTGKLIPIYKVTTKENGQNEISLTNSPIFIKYDEVYIFYETSSNNLKLADYKDVKKYLENILEKYGNKNNYNNALNKIFADSENIYNIAAIKSKNSDIFEIKRLLKELN